MNVIINTIYCDVATQDPVISEWKQAAEQAKGNFFSISFKDSLNLKDNFLDKKLSDFNEKLNTTYVPFGPYGQKSFNRMLLQDENSSMAGVSFFRERVIFKVSESFKNPTWDLVDAFEVDSSTLTRLDLSKETALNFGSNDDLTEFVKNKQYMRESYKEVIKLRYEMIKKYLGENEGDKDLHLAIRKIIDKEGRKRNFEFEPK